MSRKVEDGTLRPEWADVRRVSEIARATVVLVMERNIAKGTRWRHESSYDHCISAVCNLDPNTDNRSKKDIEDALCRLAMALTIMEKEE